MALIGQASWPATVRWWYRPSPGTVGVDQFISHSPIGGEYLLYLPEQSDGPWPLIVFLHGSGSRGTDPNVLRDSGPFLHLRPASLSAMIAAPQCPPENHWEPAAIAAFVDHLASQYHVDGERIYLAGFSMGGDGTWETAAADPDRIAAILPIAGGGDPEDAAALSKLPIWAFHGDKRAAGGSPQLTVLPEAGHGICQDVCGRPDVWQWLLRQRLTTRK